MQPLKASPQQVLYDPIYDWAWMITTNLDKNTLLTIDLWSRRSFAAIAEV